ncbi:uncharacterized protein LOC104892453 isoform X2 [Beta vulgaris subsp. vulgaris]|uniref:uncharacterized protein LOC104892453 isoform X2 n=1 Tax=Beta vulgaris subsp. vulgaris TaxID=3555 RepID=UPI00254892A9|nr:uncharacterized protein LOC104892453 isoform X2 [Beta vulgaris subsp. vulgaris]
MAIMNKPLKPHFTLSPPYLSSPFLAKPTHIFKKCSLNFRVYNFNPTSSSNKMSYPSTQPSSSSMVSEMGPTVFKGVSCDPKQMEEALEKVIYSCRFVTFLGVFGSLIGSILCFVKGCSIVGASFFEHFAKSGKVIVLLVEAIDVYLLGTVMLVFGMGLYELFVSNLDIAKSLSEAKHRSNLFGLFPLTERPKWLEIKSVNELKTKVGHVIVMLLLIGLFDHNSSLICVSMNKSTAEGSTPPRCAAYHSNTLIK